MNIQIDFAFNSLLDDPLAISQDIIGRLPAKNPLDPSAIQIMKNWISSCTSSHIFCRPTTELTAVPTRILRILDKENLCLCDYDASLGQYAAISYCWGTGQPFKLVTHNMRQLRCGFPISSLSKTLQDFIKVCRVLGINFAWADATCIIQDDDSDWERESAKMGAIYRNAFVTISADAAQDSMDGFLKARPTPSVAPARFSSTCSNSMISGTIIALPLNHKAERDRTRSSVSQRGWCLQQHVLSRRTIHFRENQLSWECMTVELSEDNTPPGFWITGLKRRLAAGRYVQKSLLYIWDSIVTDYTQRQLTHQTDFFPALAGIAQAIAPSLAADETKDYLAGLWRQNLPLNLLWKTKYGGGTPQPPYCAPSWSWASIASEIHNPWLPDDGLEYSISITSISVTPQSVHKPLGAIVSGSLTSKNCRVRRMRIQESKWIPGSYNVRDDGNWKAIGLIDFDDSKFQPPDELDSVLICVFNIPTEGILKGSIRSYFLALMPVEARISSQDRDATFRRVGTGYLWEENWYFGSEARVADLVIV